MDSSTKVQLLTRGLEVNPGDLSPEERVEVMKYWIEAERIYFQYLPIFHPLRERIDSATEPNPRRTRGPVGDNVVGLLGSGVDGRLKVTSIKYFWSSSCGETELRKTILLDEKGRFLLEQVKLKVEWRSRNDKAHEVLRDYTACPLDDAEIIQHELTSSLFQETFSLIVGSMRRDGQNKVDWGNAMLHRADQMRERLGTAVRW